MGLECAEITLYLGGDEAGDSLLERGAGDGVNIAKIGWFSTVTATGKESSTTTESEGSATSADFGRINSSIL